MPTAVGLQVRRDMEVRPEAVNLQDELYLKKVADRMPDVGRKWVCMRSGQHPLPCPLGVGVYAAWPA